MFTFYIARRYLFARKRHHTTGIIAAISVAGVALATAAMVVTLSVFNGFRDLVASLFTAFDPQLRVSLVEGTAIAADDSSLVALGRHPMVAAVTPVLQDQALVVVHDQQWAVTIKGVGDNFLEQNGLESILYGDGHAVLHADVLDYGIMGIRLAASMGLGTSYEGGLPVYAPRRGERVNMANPMSSFRRDELYSPGVVFAVGQQNYDATTIVTSLRFAQHLFDREGQVSAVEVRLHDGVGTRSGRRELQRMLGSRFRVSDRYEQQEDTFRIMQVEKFIAYLFLSFILLVASFNIIGSLSMLMIEKRDDCSTLRSMGATRQQVERIFHIEGWLISGLGAAIGLVLGAGLCLLQQHTGLVALGHSEGAFIVDAYPVSLHGTDLAAVFATVVVVGIVAVSLPVRHMVRSLDYDNSQPHTQPS